MYVYTLLRAGPSLESGSPFPGPKDVTRRAGAQPLVIRASPWVHEAEGTPSEGCTPEGEAVPSRGSQGTPRPPPPGDGTSLDRGPRGVYLPPSILRAKGSQARAWHSITTS